MFDGVAHDWPSSWDKDGGRRHFTSFLNVPYKASCGVREWRARLNDDEEDDGDEDGMQVCKRMCITCSTWSGE
jgi:hypothetical protein